MKTKRKVHSEQKEVLSYEVTETALPGEVRVSILDGSVNISWLSDLGPTEAKIPVEMADMVCRILGAMRANGDVPTTET